ncbi:MAG: recombinase family protein [Pseudomonadota bacterium]
MKLGYLRVSTKEQTPARQIDSLNEHCDELLIEEVSANCRKRPVFIAAQRRLRAGDALVILDLDRAFRSTLEALTVMYRLLDRDIGLEVLSLNINTATPEGELMYTITAAYARYEWRCLSRRTKQGMAAAQARGAKVGRRPALDMSECEEALFLMKCGMPISDVAARLGVGRSTMYRYAQSMEAAG